VTRDSKFDWVGLFVSPSFLCHVTVNWAEMSVAKSQLSVPYDAKLFICLHANSRIFQ